MYVYTVSYTMDTLYFTWIDIPVDIERNLQLPQFALRGYVQHDCSQNYTAGRHTQYFTCQLKSIFIKCPSHAVEIFNDDSVRVSVCLSVTIALLTPPADYKYNLRDRPHNRQILDLMSLFTIVILLFACCFVTVIDCIDCIYFLSSCILSVHLFYNCGLPVVIL